MQSAGDLFNHLSRRSCELAGIGAESRAGAVHWPWSCTGRAGSSPSAIARLDGLPGSRWPRPCRTLGSVSELNWITATHVVLTGGCDVFDADGQGQTELADVRVAFDSGFIHIINSQGTAHSALVDMQLDIRPAAAVVRIEYVGQGAPA